MSDGAQSQLQKVYHIMEVRYVDFRLLALLWALGFRSLVLTQYLLLMLDRPPIKRSLALRRPPAGRWAYYSFLAALIGKHRNSAEAIPHRRTVGLSNIAKVCAIAVCHMPMVQMNTAATASRDRQLRRHLSRQIQL
jgi:hypothetical protein